MTAVKHVSFAASPQVMPSADSRDSGSMKGRRVIPLGATDFRLSVTPQALIERMCLDDSHAKRQLSRRECGSLCQRIGLKDFVFALHDVAQATTTYKLEPRVWNVLLRNARHKDKRELLELKSAVLKKIPPDEIDSNTFIIFVGAAGKIGRLDLALFSFLRLMGRGLNTQTFNVFLDAARSMGQLLLVGELLDIAIDVGKADATSFNIFIDLAIRMDRFDLVEKAFNEATEYNIADAETFIAYIVTATNKDRFDLAEKAYQLALEKEITGIVNPKAV